MTLLPDQEKPAIVSTFDVLRQAIETGGPNLFQKFIAFQSVYRGNARPYVDAFPMVTDLRQWVGQLRLYLREEIEPKFWGVAG
jgi:hypothetical protein